MVRKEGRTKEKGEEKRTYKKKEKERIEGKIKYQSEPGATELFN